jgi:hypothetical protein
MRFKIPYPPTKAGKAQWAKDYGLNAYYAGKHWSKRKKDAEFWHALVRSELRKQGIKPRPFREAVIISFWWNDRLDIDNHAAMGKMIVDALKGVLLQDDTKKYVKGVGHLFHDEDYILVEVTEIK